MLLRKKDCFSNAIADKLEHIELIKKYAPIYSIVYWNFFEIYIYKSKICNQTRNLLYIRGKTGVDFTFYKIAPVLIKIKWNVTGNQRLNCYHLFHVL